MRKIRRNNSSHSILPCKRFLGAITITAHDIPFECDRPSLQSVPHSKVRLSSSRTMTSLSQGHHRINPLDFTNTHETHAHTRVKTKRRRDEEIVRIHTPATCCEFGARGQHLQIIRANIVFALIQILVNLISSLKELIANHFHTTELREIRYKYCHQIEISVKTTRFDFSRLITRTNCIGNLEAISTREYR